jgi:hypothetical protein
MILIYQICASLRGVLPMSHQLRQHWEGNLHVTILNTHRLQIRYNSRAFVRYYRTICPWVIHLFNLEFSSVDRKCIASRQVPYSAQLLSDAYNSYRKPPKTLGLIIPENPWKSKSSKLAGDETKSSLSHGVKLIWRSWILVINILKGPSHLTTLVLLRLQQNFDDLSILPIALPPALH